MNGFSQLETNSFSHECRISTAVGSATALIHLQNFTVNRWKRSPTQLWERKMAVSCKTELVGLLWVKWMICTHKLTEGLCYWCILLISKSYFNVCHFCHHCCFSTFTVSGTGNEWQILLFLKIYIFSMNIWQLKSCKISMRHFFECNTIYLI